MPGEENGFWNGRAFRSSLLSPTFPPVESKQGGESSIESNDEGKAHGGRNARDELHRLLCRMALAPALVVDSLLSHGFLGLLTVVLLAGAVPLVIVLVLVFAPIPMLVKAVVAVGILLTWGVERQEH